MAVENDKITGHILLTKIMIGSNVELALAPLSVLPDHQKRGIGSALINEGHRIAKTLGYSYFVVLGSSRVTVRRGMLRRFCHPSASPFENPSVQTVCKKCFFIRCLIGQLRGEPYLLLDCIGHADNDKLQEFIDLLLDYCRRFFVE